MEGKYSQKQTKQIITFKISQNLIIFIISAEKENTAAFLKECFSGYFKAYPFMGVWNIHTYELSLNLSDRVHQKSKQECAFVSKLKEWIDWYFIVWSLTWALLFYFVLYKERKSRSCYFLQSQILRTLIAIWHMGAENNNPKDALPDALLSWLF